MIHLWIITFLFFSFFNKFLRISFCLQTYSRIILQEVVKADASHVGAEKYIADIFDSWAIFRPQYMIGSGNNKDCEEWFFDSKFSYGTLLLF